ncbi:MAG: 3-deoxy-D-manno-octulosonic acid transferase, partial [Paracoccaceae bacterium]|nr:3-deoxy-D-manno-octulosonic acid transferase [Paracoccaceae bacterium]
KPLYVFVPRAPEAFDDLFQKIEDSGLSVIRRSQGFSDDLQPSLSTDWNNIDVILGDSFGEMYFYLKLCGQVVAGGGFWHTGAHNIIEQLQLHKNVIVGPEIWTIKFPAYQAQKAGLLKVVKDPSELTRNLRLFLEGNDTNKIVREKFDEFLNDYAGASNKTVAMLENEGVI